MDVYDAVYRMVAEHKLQVRGKRVVIKPNLVEFDPDTAINTNPIVVHAAFEAFRKLGAAEVKIAEGPGHRRATTAWIWRTQPGIFRRCAEIRGCVHLI